MERIVSDNNEANRGAALLEELKVDIKMLQKLVKDQTFGEMLENSEMERLRKEVFNLERLLIDLNGEYEQKKPKHAVDYDWEDERVEYEVRLQKSRAREDALTTEMKHDNT